MKIRIVKDESAAKLWIGIASCGVVGDELWFGRECASPIERELLREHLIAALNNTFERIRRVSYMRGWRDAKSKKRAKEQWFPCGSDVVDWERKEAGL